MRAINIIIFMPLWHSELGQAAVGERRS